MKEATFANTFHKKMATQSGIWPKKEFQNMLRQIKKNEAITVTKKDAGYDIHMSNGKGHNFLMMRAMNGRRGYLTRAVKDFLTVS